MKRFLAYGPFIFCCTLLFYTSSLSSISLTQSINFLYFDKILHFLAYSALGATALLASIFRVRKCNLYVYIEAVIIASLYGVFDEIHQLFVPGRTFEILDLFFDFLGSITGAYISYLLVCMYLKSRK